jgi:hypothetical protein
MAICTDPASDTWVDVSLASIAGFIRNNHEEAGNSTIATMYQSTLFAHVRYTQTKL